MDCAPHRHGLSDRHQSEQRPDQFSAPAKLLRLPSLQSLVGEFRFCAFEQQRERHSERDELPAPVPLAGDGLESQSQDLSNDLPLPGPTPRNASQERADFFPSRVFYPSHSRPKVRA
jgi:hypothetical protein